MTRPAPVYPPTHGEAWTCPVCGGLWPAYQVVPGFRCEHPTWKPKRRDVDSQRSAVYRWENDLRRRFPRMAERLDDLGACAALVAEVWEDYRPGTSPPALKDGRGRRSAYGTRHAIGLPVWSRTRGIVLHEVAHSLVEGVPHGRPFARLLAELLERYCGVPIGEALRAGREQRPRRVWFAKVAACPKPAGRAVREWNAERSRLQRIAREAQDALRAHELTRPKP